MTIRSVLLMGFALLLAACRTDKDNPIPVPPPQNRAPVANAGADVSGLTGEMLTLSGNNSSDPDGDALMYEWTVTSGPAGAGALTQATSASARFSATAAGDYIVRLTVRDPANLSVSDNVTVTVADPPVTVASVAIDKPFLFLDATGQSAPLSAQVRDSAGAIVNAPVTWISSAPNQVNVDSSGRVVAATIGSALVVARAGGIDSAPTLVVVAQPKPGAVLVTDAQIQSVGPPIGLLPGEAAVIGTRYEVRLRGVAAPAAGTVILASETSPVAGKVVSTRTEDGDLIATLEIAPLYDLLARYHIDWTIDLSSFPLVSTDAPVASRAKARVAVRARAGAVNASETKAVGPVKCDGEFEAKLANITIAVSATPNLSLVLKDYRDEPTLPPNYSRHSLEGSAAFEGTAKVVFKPALSLTGTCKAEVHFDIPALGWVSLVVMPRVALGVGFELSGEVVVATAELGGTLNLDLKPVIGWQCGGAQPECRGIDDVTLESKFTPIQTFEIKDGAHVNLEGHVFAFARLEALIFAGLGGSVSILEGRIGPKQSLELATEETQAANHSMASNYDLKIDASIKPGAAIKDAIKKLIADDAIDVSFSIKEPIPIVESPRGTLKVSKTRVALGDKVTFSVDIKPETKDYLGLGPNFGKGYNIDSVGLWRKGKDDDEFKFFRNMPPIASGDSTAFAYEWTPDGVDGGKSEFAALVNTKFPLPHLEVEPDSVREVEVVCFTAAQKITQKIGALATGQCANEWSGFSNHLVPDGESLTSLVTWKRDETFEVTGTLVRYVAQGTFEYHHLIFEAGGCTVSPTIFNIEPPSPNSSNALYVDFTPLPGLATFSGSGVQATQLTVSCPDDEPFTIPASITWFTGAGNVSADRLTISGGMTTPFASSSFQFQRP